MTLPPHTASPSDVRGYDRIDWTPPSAGMESLSFKSLARLSAVNRDDPEFRARVRSIVAAQDALKPWTLTPMPGASFSLVARRRTWWMRAWTWWLNRRRRRVAADVRRRQAVYFAPEQVAARQRASQ